MNEPLPPENAAGKPSALDYPGPPKFAGQADGEVRADSKMMGWRWHGGEWHMHRLHRLVYVVVESEGVFAMPRAWAFETEEEAVAFRLKRNDGNRRPGSNQPVLMVPLGNPHFDGFAEVDWKKYPAPKPQEKQKWT